MDIRISISRTFQAKEFEPVKIEIEAAEKESTDFKNTSEKLYEKIEEALVKSEMKLRDIYCPTTNEKNRKRKRV